MTSFQSLTMLVLLYLARPSHARVSVLEKTLPPDRSPQCAASLRVPLSKAPLLFLRRALQVLDSQLKDSRVIPRCRPFSFVNMLLKLLLTSARSSTRRARIRWKQYHWRRIGNWAKVFLVAMLPKQDTLVRASTRLQFM